MKRKMKAKLIALLLAILSLFVFAGCSMGESLDEVLDTRNLSPHVTYYANGGLFESNNAVKDLYYSVGSKALNIGTVNPISGSVDIKRDGFEIVGWCIAESVDEETGICELGEEWDFSTELQEGEHIILAAKWRALVGLKVIMVCDTGDTIAVDKKVENDATLQAETFKSGDVIGEIAYDSKDSVTSGATPDTRLFTVKDKTHTFFSYYWDAECTQEVSWPLTRGEEQQTVYAKYIRGNWTFVKTADDAYKMFNALKGGVAKSYWICNDINFTKNVTLEGITSFAGEIQGNGYTISGLKFSKSLTQGLNKFSIFGDIKETARITDLTLSNISVNLKLRPNIHTEAYLVFQSIADGATISNVSIAMAETDGFIIDGPDSSFVDNINGTGTVTYENCLYGGYSTDERYITESAGQGFTVVGTPEAFIIIK